MKIWITLIATISLPACDRNVPPAPTSQEAARLDEAETMLNDMAENDEGAAPEDTAPSNTN